MEINNEISFNVQTKVLPTKGNLVYEYNPFRNYRLTQIKYEYQEQLYTEQELEDNFNIFIDKTYEVVPNATIQNGKKVALEDGPAINIPITAFKDGSYRQHFKIEGRDPSNNPVTDECGNYLPNGTPAVAWVVRYNNKLYWEEDFLSNINSIFTYAIGTQWLKKTAVEGKEVYEPLTEDLPILHEKGELVDFVTDELKFDLKHPVNIVPQYSYDGSVNLIINDGINTPKLINSRFSATGKNTYEIIDRKGNNDTNIYDQGDQFEIDTSLYKRVISIPKLSYEGTSSGGNLKVGNYHFYIKLSDADGNETDFVAESGLVSVFIGFGNPDSLTTGVKNQNSFKTVNLYMSNIDSAYDYLYVYYSRYTAEQGENFNTEYIKIDKKFVVSNQGTCNISINGYEPTIPITATDINDTFEIVDAAKVQVSCQNMLFLGNVHKPEIPYKELSDLSLHFLPYLKNKDYECKFDQNYNINTSSLGYWDSQYIYNYVGYWNNEFYRLGVVYILPNGELTPVFNIRGCSNVVEYKEAKKEAKKEDTKDGENPDKKDYSSLYTDIPLYINNERNYINYSETDYQLVANTVRDKDLKSTALNENIKGVIRFQSNKDADTIHSLDIRINDEAMQELKKYVKGFFFVRQTRIPTILAQGITLGLDQNSYTPTIPTAGGLLEQLSDSLDKTYVTTEDINDVNYVSEGFLSRYQFKFKKKSSSLWGKIGKIAAITAGVVALGAATVFTAGAAGALVAGSTLAGAVTAGSTTLGGVLVAGGAVTTGLGLSTGVAGASAIIAVGAGTAAGLITAIAATSQEVTYGIQTWKHKKLDGRNTKCPKGYKITEVDDSRKVGGDFENRIIVKDSSKNKTQVILCPDFEVNQAYFNQLFTGNEHLIESTKAQGNNLLLGHSSNYFSEDVISNYRHYYIPDYYDTNSSISGNYKLISVPEDVKCVGLDNLKFRSRAGYAEEAWQYESVGDEYKTENDKNNKSEADEETISNKQINTDIVRGVYGAYLGVSNTSDKLTPATTVNIYIPKYNSSNILKYIQIRMDDNSTYFAITDRIDISESDNYLVTKKSQLINDSTDFYKDGYQFSAFRGDCYICQFTHRIIRNFNSPSAPYNDEIVDENTWKDNYNPSKTESYENINLGDVNAVQLGMWVTFRVRSSYNLNIRTLDSSNVDEKQMTGHARGYYPYAPMSVEGTYKIPESHIYNKGFSKSLSDRWNNLLPDVPYIKNWFGTRIMYSDIHINDAYKNGYRVFRKTNKVDYTREYGEITKLISLNSNLLIIFEHGIAIAPVNQITVQQTSGQLVATSRVLPEAPTVISDMFGSQWADSILKTPGKRGDSTQYVYGVDTIAKKIWKTDGSSLICISDAKVQEFLNNNITLGERETTPTLGVRNVKTCYNSYKGDVMFTFYDNTTGFQEKVWNLCYNELLDKFITFYSWVPSFMENINNIPFSFNRDTSKWIAKLGTSHSTSSFADGITLTNVVFDPTLDERVVQNISVPISYLTKNGTYKTTYGTVMTTSYFIGILQLSNRVIPNYNVPYDISYELCRDIYGNYKNFTLQKLKFANSGGEMQESFPLSNVEDALFPTHDVSVYGLYINPKSPLYTRDLMDKQGTRRVYLTTRDGNKIGSVFIHKDLRSMLLSELYYRNKENHAYSDTDVNKWEPNTKESLNIGEYQLTANSVQGVTSDNYLEKFKETEAYRIINDLYSQYNKLSAQIEVSNDTQVSKSTNIMSMYSKWKQLVTYSDNMFKYDGSPIQAYIVHAQTITYSELIHTSAPIFKNLQGKREMLPKDKQINPDTIVKLLNIRATINATIPNSEQTLEDYYYNKTASYNVATYESTVAIIPKWNMQFLSADFWKHGQAGSFDIADDIYPCYWYGKQHPFEFEFIVVNDPSVHKIFTNLELIANKAKPESFHYEVIGEAYDFAKDKPNMYFRQEAMKALWQYNGCDIEYNSDFLKVQTRQQNKSADLPHNYFARTKYINEVEDSYIMAQVGKHDYRHLSGGEIVYYQNRQEFRVWNHVPAIDVDDQLDTSASSFGGRGLMASNMRYLEDRWKVQINPLLITYKNEYERRDSTKALCIPENSTWKDGAGTRAGDKLPPLPLYNSPIPDVVKERGEIAIPGYSYSVLNGYKDTTEGKDNAMYNLYKVDFENGIHPFDTSSWLDDVNIYKYNFGSAQNRKETDMRDKFIKIRIRYSGKELAIIDFINTIYQVSYA